MLRSVPLVAVAALALALAGCATAAPQPVSAGPGDGWKYYGIDSGSGGTDDGATGDPVILGENTYDLGTPSGMTVEWADTLFADPDFSVKSPDDGAGHWAYTQLSTGCDLSFWQTDARGIDPVGDEKARSDAALAQFLGWEPSDLSDAFDVLVPFTGGSGATFDARAVEGTDDDGSDWITLSRAFDGPRVALSLDVTCPQGVDAATQLAAYYPDRVAAREH